MKKHITLLIFIFFIGFQGHSQVLISLIFGDKLNSEHIEFGLEGGVNFSSLDGISSDSKSNFNLGFYFDFDINKNPRWKFNTGVIVKSTMGAEDIAIYSLDNEDLDEAFAGGSIQRKINYFNVPLVIKRQISSGFYVGLGTMLGLRSKATDIFTKKVEEDDDLTYKLDIKDNITTIDAGILVNLNYKLGKTNGMNLFAKYYYGLVNVNSNDAMGKHYNRSFYLGVGIPIGGKQKKEKDNTES